ncbi:uncharacterized protein HD556DRAFT_1307805 [Suillus plorans]|uniref:Uncharacterized protein n=1 Tax=Suillus plorans TaxID=116603 RepID=A0A9P7ARB6_9AGAM|nr:uncharacterized protein HD556DRAFT_1307805 [Suillus plorans]KAG1794793.1 hypothetical protein HD556DRAFT_1307805 [Suillus plorans]
MSTTSTITIRSHSSQSHSPKNNSQGRPTCKVKVIERYKQPPTRLATSWGRKPATKDTSTSQATLREVNPNLTKAPITARHKVLKFVSQSNGEADCEVFQNITQADYNYISCKIEDYPARPRLEYNCNTHTLVIEMPSPVHKAIIKVIGKGLERLDDYLQDLMVKNLLSSDTHTNLTIDGNSVKCVPDVLHVVTALTDPPILSTPVMGEVAVLQSRADLLQRLRDRVEAFPDIILLFMAEINERVTYSQPKHMSNAWRKLQKDENARSRTTFLSNRTGPRSLDVPAEIEVEGHVWHAMSSVHFQVWVQDVNGRIDIDTQNQNLTACGELFPNKSMDNVTLMMERGLSRMREQYAQLSQQVSPNVDVSALLAAPVTLPFGWDGMLSKLALASLTMAHDRYKHWHSVMARSRTAKRTAEEAFDAGPANNTRSRTRARTAALVRGQSLP